MNRWVKRVLIGVGAVVVVGVSTAAIYAKVQASAFDASMDKVYDLPVPAVTRSTDPAVLARGKHLVESIGACASRDCHGTDLGGGKTLDMGPLGTLTGPNISQGGLGAVYSDGEIARLIRHGVKKDGRSLRFMPAQDVNWLPDADLVAIVSYLRTQPAVDRPNGPVKLGTIGKVLDRRGLIVLDVARHIDHAKVEIAGPPAPTADYGRFVTRLCVGCHGDRLSGGKIPGAPPSFPVPLNLTPHETGLKDWSYDDFVKLMTKGLRKNGKQLDPFMPLEAVAKMDDTEMRALWEYLRSVPPAPFGGR